MYTTVHYKHSVIASFEILRKILILNIIKGEKISENLLNYLKYDLTRQNDKLVEVEQQSLPILILFYSILAVVIN